MARRIKINSNPNKTPASGKRNPTEQDIYEKELRDVRQDKLGFKESSSKKTIKVNSNPVPSQPRTTGGITGAGAKNVGKVYRSGGGGLGGIFGNKIR